MAKRSNKTTVTEKEETLQVPAEVQEQTSPEKSSEADQAAPVATEEQTSTTQEAGVTEEQQQEEQPKQEATEEVKEAEEQATEEAPVEVAEKKTASFGKDPFLDTFYKRRIF